MNEEITLEMCETCDRKVSDFIVNEDSVMCVDCADKLVSRFF